MVSRLERLRRSRETLDNLRAEGNYHWFRKANRLSVEEDALGIYQYPTQTALTLPEMSNDLARAIVTQIAKTDNAWTTLETTGNLIVDGMFSWLFNGVDVDGKHEPGIEDLIDEAFKMYLHHRREVNGESNRGWLRIMYFGWTRQIVRQDLGNWILYVALRPDRNPIRICNTQSKLGKATAPPFDILI